MANETTTTTITELVYAEWISPMIQGYGGHYQNPSQFFQEHRPLNGSATVAVPRLESDEGSAYDRGTGVDTEYGATEGTDVTTNIDISLADSTFTAAEYVIRREITGTALEDNINGGQLFDIANMTGTRILTSAMNDDACALFASVTGSSGSTGVNLAVADVDDALYDMADRSVIGQLVGILDNQAMRDFLDSLQATGANAAIYAGTAEAMMGVRTAADQGRNLMGYTLNYKGVDFYRNDLTDTANAGADVVSCLFVTGATPEAAAFGQVWKRPIRLGMERNESLRTTELIYSARWGCGAQRSDTAQKLVTDAP